MALIYPVILCGGTGTRLWPLSRRSMPKPFLNLAGKDSLFQQAILRVSGRDFAAPLVITANDYRFIAAQQLADIGIIPIAIVANCFIETPLVSAAAGCTLVPPLAAAARKRPASRHRPCLFR